MSEKKEKVEDNKDEEKSEDKSEEKSEKKEKKTVKKKEKKIPVKKSKPEPLNLTFKGWTLAMEDNGLYITGVANDGKEEVKKKNLILYL